MLDAASLAAILDPERKVQGWWREIYFVPDGEISMCPKEWTFTGPPDLATAREHCWRKEDWLEARGYGWTRARPLDSDRFWTYILVPYVDTYINTDHAAALNAAIERISNEQKR